MHNSSTRMLFPSSVRCPASALTPRRAAPPARLLTDRSPEARSALEGILYGPAGPAAPLDAKRVAQIATAFSTYTAVTGNERCAPPGLRRCVRRSEAEYPYWLPRVLRPGADSSIVRSASLRSTGSEPAAKLGSTEREALRLLFSPDGGPMQDIVTREIARLAGSAAALSAETFGATVAGRFVVNAAQQQQAAFTAAMGSNGGASAGLPAEGAGQTPSRPPPTHLPESGAATLCGLSEALPDRSVKALWR